MEQNIARRRSGNPNWVKGVTGNPRGRPKTGTAFAEAVRERVDPATLIDIALDIARGLPAIRDLQLLRARAEAEAKGLPPPPVEGVEVVWPTHSERLAALTFLRTSGWQNPVQTVAFDNADQPMLDPAKLSQAELDQLETIYRKAATVGEVIDIAPLVSTLPPGKP